MSKQSSGAQFDAEFASKVRQWAADQPQLAAVILFGSRAKERATAQSDWDICCLVESQADESWYSIWHHSADDWKKGFCAVAGLSETTVQFCAPTSPQVLEGLLESSKVLYVRSALLPAARASSTQATGS